MDPQITAALIGGVSALAGAVLTWWLGRAPREISRFHRVSTEAGAGFRGVWRGTFYQPEYPTGPLTSEIEMRLNVRRNFVVGTFRVKTTFPGETGHGQLVEIELDARGGLYSDSLLKLEYKNITPGVLQFGTAVLRINARSTEMMGRFVGFGSYAEEIVHGTLRLAKVSMSG